MKVLVTGGAGFIGSNLTKFLCDKGHQVKVVDDLSFGFRELVDKRAVFYKGSFADRKLLDKVLPGIDVVFHLAATATITFSANQPKVYFENNFKNGISLLEAVRKAGVRKIVYSSSGASYGQPEITQVRETSQTEPINPYGASKLIFEHALRAYYHAFRIESVSLRYFNVYGPRDEQKFSTRAIPRWIQAGLKNEPATLYWGGKQIRDYVYVEDVARANLLAAQKGCGCKVYNVGGGKGIVMKDIIRKLELILGRRLKIKNLGKRSGDPQAVIADISRIQKDLGWTPLTDFDSGLSKTVDYFKNHRIIV